MADKKDDNFLGGGIRFNSAGVGASPDSEPIAEIAPQGVQPHQIRAAIIITAVVIMLAILFKISVFGLGGVVESHGGRHAPAQERPAGTDKDF